MSIGRKMKVIRGWRLEISKKKEMHVNEKETSY